MKHKRLTFGILAVAIFGSMLCLAVLIIIVIFGYKTSIDEYPRYSTGRAKTNEAIQTALHSTYTFDYPEGTLTATTATLFVDLTRTAEVDPTEISTPTVHDE